MTQLYHISTLNSHLQLDCTSWSPQWYHQYPSSSLLYCSFTWQCSSLSNNGTGSSSNWQRALQHTPSHIISLSYFLVFTPFLLLLILPLVFHFYPLSARHSLLSHLSPFSTPRPSLLIYPCSPSLFSSSCLLFPSSLFPLPFLWMDWQLLSPSLFFWQLAIFTVTARSLAVICTIMWNPTFHADLTALQYYMTVDNRWVSIQWQVCRSLNYTLKINLECTYRHFSENWCFPRDQRWTEAISSHSRWEID